MDINSGTKVAKLKKKNSTASPGKPPKAPGAASSASPPSPPEAVVPGRWQGGGDDAAKVAELQAMAPEARTVAVTEVLHRLGAPGERPERRAAAQDLAVVLKTLGLATLIQTGTLENLHLSLTDADAKPAAKTGALFVTQALCEKCGAWFEPYALQLLPAVLVCAAAKQNPVREAAGDTSKAIILQLNPRAARLVLPTLFDGMESDDWRIKFCAVQLVGMLATHAKDQLNVCMPLIVPKITTCLRDTKKEVSKASKKALQDAVRVCGNPDIAPVVPAIIAAIRNPDDTQAALDDLMHTTFVHQVDAASLSIIVPILSRSLSDRGMHPKRKTAIVVVNMCKLVLNPADVEPFAPRLLPELKRCAEDSSFEEIRDQCAAAAEVLETKLEEARRAHGNGIMGSATAAGANGAAAVED